MRERENGMRRDSVEDCPSRCADTRVVCRHPKWNLAILTPRELRSNIRLGPNCSISDILNMELPGKPATDASVIEVMSCDCMSHSKLLNRFRAVAIDLRGGVPLSCGGSRSGAPPWKKKESALFATAPKRADLSTDPRASFDFFQSIHCHAGQQNP